jgi:hypothetical protein
MKKAAPLKVRNKELGAQFEMFLPEGWRVTKAKRAAKKNLISRRKSAKKPRKR